MSFVVDNSVAIAMCFESEQTPGITSVLHRLIETGAFAPQLWPIEALNVLLQAERRRRIDRPSRVRLSRFLRDLPIAIDNETVDRLWTTTAGLAERHKLTAYDATYLELALRLGLPLATCDKELMVAAHEIGVPLLPVG